nr:MAG TPA: hypothetical protein [Caudoviricetes sp.]
MGTVWRGRDRRILRRWHASIRGLLDPRGPEARLSRTLEQRARLG